MIVRTLRHFTRLYEHGSCIGEDLVYETHLLTWLLVVELMYVQEIYPPREAIDIISRFG
jgi:hypothetical protein